MLEYKLVRSGRRSVGLSVTSDGQVERILPDWRIRKRWLNEHGKELLRSLPKETGQNGNAECTAGKNKTDLQ